MPSATSDANHQRRQPELRYDQDWALAALQYIDAQSATGHAAQFLQPDGLWQQWATTNRVDAAERKQWFDDLCSLVAGAYITSAPASADE